MIRSYWYVIYELQYNDFFASDSFKQKLPKDKLKYFKEYAPSKASGINNNTKGEQLNKILKECFSLLEENESSICSQFAEWKRKESIIQEKTDRLQYQRFGYLKVKLDNGKGNIGFISEKGVDIKLATDLITLHSVYDIAIIVSGDGDYIPAVTAIKNRGKQVLIVDFKNQKGQFLPGGSRKLKEHCDFSFSMNYKTMYDICRFGMNKSDPPKTLDLDSEYKF